MSRSVNFLLIAALSAAILSGCIREKDFSLARKGDPIVFGAGSSARGKASVKSSDADTSAGGYYDSVHEFVMDCSDILGNDDEGLRASVASCCGESMGNISGKTGPDTKTDYSGVVTGGRERIDWVTGDKIHIIGEGVDPSKMECSYKVNSVSASGARSSASLSPISADGHGLLWGSGNADFFAFYPGDATGIATGTLNPGSFDVSVKLGDNYIESSGILYEKIGATAISGGRLWKPDMGYASMMAVTRDVSPTTTAVPLGFLPLVTTVDVTITNPSSKSIKIRSLDLFFSSRAVGDFKVKIDRSSGTLNAHSQLVAVWGDGSTAAGAAQTLRCRASSGPVYDDAELLPNGGSSLTIRLLCSPVNDLAPEKLILNIIRQGSSTPEPRTLKLVKSDNSPVTLSKFGKHNIKVSLTGSSGYVLEVVPVNGGVANPITYNGGTASFTVKSYRKRVSEDGTVTPAEAAPWHITKYETSYDGTNFVEAGITPPSWLMVPVSSGTGSTGSAVSIGATFKKNISPIDFRAKLNAELKSAPEKGNSSSPYNLSNQTNGGDAIENTANCYLISAPGWYRLPLVYGNAIKNGSTNESAYKASPAAVATAIATAVPFLKVFKDHLEREITSPYINVQSTIHGGSNATSAYIVWADASGIVYNLQLEGNGANAFLKFHVPADKICNGNAVVAVKDGSGNVMWSWHLWFDRDDALDKIPVKNYGGIIYKFSKYPLGNVWFRWEKFFERYIRITVSQNSPAGIIKTVVIKQKKATDQYYRECRSPYYQWGRKDALPLGHLALQNGGDNMSIQNSIQHPITFYTDGNSWINIYNYYNLWSMENVEKTFNDNPVVKTIYDPCPVGFHVPASNAFTGFTKTGQNTISQNDLNVIGNFNFGYDFKTGYTEPDAIFFPTYGSRRCDNGTPTLMTEGIYMSCVPGNLINGGRCLLLLDNYVQPITEVFRAEGCSIRPVSED
ncbi:MAG: hypothetical protein ACTTK1_01770 [Candidatus Cryptobacteroides sp.]